MVCERKMSVETSTASRGHISPICLNVTAQCSSAESLQLIEKFDYVTIMMTMEINLNTCCNDWF